MDHQELLRQAVSIYRGDGGTEKPSLHHSEVGVSKVTLKNEQGNLLASYYVEKIKANGNNAGKPGSKAQITNLLILAGLGIAGIAIFNPFQKNISKSINVTTSMSPVWSDDVAERCYKTSISKAQLDNLLSNGVKVITMSPTSFTNLDVEMYASNFTCNGYTYVLEGPENLLNKP